MFFALGGKKKGPCNVEKNKINPGINLGQPAEKGRKTRKRKRPQEQVLAYV
jgi:hypothetical protein